MARFADTDIAPPATRRRTEARPVEDNVNALTLSAELMRFVDSNQILPKYEGDQFQDLIPFVIVVGNQSSGKSSLLTALTGYSLPVSEQRTTCCIIEIRVRPGEPTVKTWVQDENGVTNYHNMEINQIHAITNGRMYNVTIICEVYSPGAKAITYVDLPGIFQQVNETDTEWEIPHAFIQRYINRKNCFIINVLNASEDIANSATHRIVNTADPQRLRTLNVYTKLDRVQNAEALVRSLKTYDPNGVLTASRDHTGLPTSVEDELSILQRFEGLSKGRNYIIDKVTSYIKTLLFQNSPRIVDSLNNFMKKINEELSVIGTQPESPHHAKVRWGRSIITLINHLQTGTGPYIISRKQLNSELGNVFDIKFPCQINVDELYNSLESLRGIEISNIQGCAKLIEDYCTGAVEMIREKVNQFIEKIEKTGSDYIEQVLDQGPYSLAGKSLINKLKREYLDRVTDLKEIIFEDLGNIPIKRCLFSTEKYCARIYEHETELERLILEGADLNTIRRLASERVNLGQNGYVLRKEANGTKIKIEVYWEGRMEDLQTTVFKKMNLILDSISTDIKNEIEFFGELDLLTESDEIRTKREVFKRAIEIATSLKTSLRV